MHILIKKIETKEVARQCVKVGMFGFVATLLLWMLSSAFLLYDQYEQTGTIPIEDIRVAIVAEVMTMFFISFFLVFVWQGHFWITLMLLVFMFSPFSVSYPDIIDSETPVSSILFVFILSFICFQAVRGAYFLRKIEKKQV